MKQCPRCLLPEGTLHVTLNGDDMCNYCRHYDAHAAALSDYPNLKRLLNARLDKIRGRYAYDAMVGLSGGKDSAYVLYKLVKEYGLKVCAVTYQNGFLTDYARRNVETIVRALGVDHEYYNPDWNVHRKFYRAALTRLGDPCLACFISGYFIAIKGCMERNIPFFVHGRSPYQMLMNFHEGSQDLFLPIMQANMAPHSFENLAQVYRVIHEKLKGWLRQLFDDPADARDVMNEFFLDSSAITPEFVPEFLAFFLFEPYDEERIKQEMERAVGYRRPERDGLLAHGDCSIHEAAVDIYRRIRGIPAVAPEVAVMLRRGEIARDGARRILAGTDGNPGALQRSFDELCEKTGVSRADIEQTVTRLRGAVPGRFDAVAHASAPARPTS